MTVQEDRPRQPDRLLMLAGHYFPVAFVALAAIAVADAVTGKHPGLLRDVTYVLFAAWYLSFYADAAYHSGRLCWRCARHVPADPERSVTRWRRFLWLHHKPWLVLLAGAPMVAVLLLSGHFPGWLDIAADAGVIAVAGPAFWAGVVHRRLRPWCPFCPDWRDGGDEEPDLEPEPDPDPAVKL